VNVYRLRDLTVTRFLLTALVVGGIAIQAGLALGLASRAPIPPTSMPAPDKLSAIAAVAEIFAAEALPCALIGGLAVGIRSGVPRATLDVDFAVATRIPRAGLTDLPPQPKALLRGPQLERPCAV
jgi:hypothetical protein